jgi:hypothetical protein
VIKVREESSLLESIKLHKKSTAVFLDRNVSFTTKWIEFKKKPYAFPYIYFE